MSPLRIKDAAKQYLELACDIKTPQIKDCK